MNVHNILSEFDFKATSATNIIAKIGYASANIGSLGVRLEIVTQDVSGLKGRVHVFLTW